MRQWGPCAFPMLELQTGPVAYSTQEIGSRYKPTQSSQLSHHITTYILTNLTYIWW